VGTSEKAGQEDTRAHGRMAGLHLREPEPGVQRREHEDERVRVHRRNQESDNAECEQCATVAGESLLRPDRPPRQKAAAGDEPAGSGKQYEGHQRSTRPGDRGQGGNVSVVASPETDRPEHEEYSPDPRPEAEPAAVAAECRCDADPAPATTGEEVDGGRE